MSAYQSSLRKPLFRLTVKFQLFSGLSAAFLKCLEFDRRVCCPTFWVDVPNVGIFISCYRFDTFRFLFFYYSISVIFFELFQISAVDASGLSFKTLFISPWIAFSCCFVAAVCKLFASSSPLSLSHQ